MYTALMAFAKSSMLGQGISAINLSVYRCAAIFIIELGSFIFVQKEKKSEATDQRHWQHKSAHYTAWLEKQKLLLIASNGEV